MNCSHAGCRNTARYIDEHGALVCGTCPVARREDSIRISDVPALLAWARAHLAGSHCFDGRDDALRALIGRKP